MNLRCVMTFGVVLYLGSIFPSMRDCINVGFVSSWGVKCGIAVYTKHLCDAVDCYNQRGASPRYETVVFNYNLGVDRLIENIKRCDIHVLDVQYDSFLYKMYGIDPVHLFKRLHELAIPVVVTVHSEAELEKVADLIDYFICHKAPTITVDPSKVNIIGIGVPIFVPTVGRVQLREKYGFSEKQCILTTFGFMATWKEYADILERMVPLLQRKKNLVIQLLTSFSDIGYKATLQECKKIRAVISKYNLKKQVIHLTNFLPQQELSERLWISDMGYLWGNIQAASCSAAAKEFISARLPAVVTNCSHYDGLDVGMFKVSANKKVFIEAIGKYVDAPNLLRRSRNELGAVYEKLNYGDLVRAHLAVFNKALEANEKNLSISYAILTHNDDSQIKRLFEFLNKYKLPQDEIIVVDDCSTNQETLSILNSAVTEFGIKLYTRRLNYDFAQQRNYVNSLCHGDYIFTIDSDEIPHTFLMMHLREIIKSGADGYLVPEVHLVDGLPKDWPTLNENGWNCWPSYHIRIFKNNQKIHWENPVDEVIVNVDKLEQLPEKEEYSIIERKHVSHWNIRGPLIHECYRRFLVRSIRENRSSKIMNILSVHPHDYLRFFYCSEIKDLLDSRGNVAEIYDCVSKLLAQQTINGDDLKEFSTLVGA